MRLLSSFVVLILLLSGCAPPSVSLAPTPTVLSDLASYPDADLPEHLRTARPRVFYITDRARLPESASQQVEYGHTRSRSMAFGARTVSFGDGLSWEELKALSLQGNDGRISIDTVSSRELVRFPATPLSYHTRAGEVFTDAEEARAYAAAGRRFQALMAAELARANRSEVVLYVHGVRNDFEAASDTVTSLWHFSGRIGVPLVYTWPAHNPGLFGYFSDRESAEFSVFHFKETLRLLSGIPALKNIHIIAHSRGTELVTAGLRETLIAERAAGRDPRQTLKIRNLVLAAADLNIDIFTQRVMAEHFTSSARQITIYANGEDTALGLAQRLMTGLRLGRITPQDVLPSDLKALEAIDNVHFINVENIPASSSHSYFRNNPNVVSDIILLLRTGAAPGSPDRPLTRLAGNFWAMYKGYPFGRPKDVFTTDGPRP